MFLVIFAIDYLLQKVVSLIYNWLYYILGLGNNIKDFIFFFYNIEFIWICPINFPATL